MSQRGIGTTRTTNPTRTEGRTLLEIGETLSGTSIDLRSIEKELRTVVGDRMSAHRSDIQTVVRHVLRRKPLRVQKLGRCDQAVSSGGW
jgi:hypothetical protein